MSPAPRDVVYIDVDDEITAIVDKVRSSSSKIVALVLPKRSAVMQSSVNVKLLKRTADETKKNVVLITSEASLLPLAGMAGLHVAKTLQSKPAVPAPPQHNDAPISVDDQGNETVGEEAPLDPAAPIGKLAGIDDEDATIEVDNDEDEVVVADEKITKKPFNKKLKVPNFERFRLGVFLAGFLAIALLVGGYFAFFVMPKATIVIKTNTTTIESNITVAAATATKEIDVDKMAVTGLLKEVKKSESQKVTATGQKDLGEKATGKITLTNCIDDGQSHTVPAGTVFASGSFSFVSDTAVTLEPSLFSGSVCKSASFGLSKTVNVTAAQAGDASNLSARTYTSPITGISASGTAMTGGVSKIVTILTQQDIDGAKQKFIDGTKSVTSTEISKQFEVEGYLALTESYASSEPIMVANPAVGEETKEATVNVTATYSMFGANKDGVTKILEKDISAKIDTSKQKILDNGLSKATIKVTDNKKDKATFTIQVLASAGVQQNSDEIKQAILGKERSEVQSLILSRPGVTDVTIDYSPKWVYKTPKKANKITIQFEQSNGR